MPDKIENISATLKELSDIKKELSETRIKHYVMCVVLKNKLTKKDWCNQISKGKIDRIYETYEIPELKNLREKLWVIKKQLKKHDKEFKTAIDNHKKPLIEHEKVIAQYEEVIAKHDQAITEHEKSKPNKKEIRATKHFTVKYTLAYFALTVLAITVFMLIPFRLFSNGYKDNSQLKSAESAMDIINNPGVAWNEWSELWNVPNSTWRQLGEDWYIVENSWKSRGIAISWEYMTKVVEQGKFGNSIEYSAFSYKLFNSISHDFKVPLIEDFKESFKINIKWGVILLIVELAIIIPIFVHLLSPTIKELRKCKDNKKYNIQQFPNELKQFEQEHMLMIQEHESLLQNQKQILQEHELM